MRISNPFRYMMREAYPSDGSIYKAWFGKKYLIWKAKSLHQSVNMLAKELDQRLRLGLKPNDPFTNVVQHIRRARVTIFEVEAVIQTDDPAALLIGEHKLLKAGEKDPDCLNTTFFPQVPKWIPETAEEEFKSYLAKLQQDKQKRAKSGTKSPGRGKRQPKKDGQYAKNAAGRKTIRKVLAKKKKK